MKKYLYNLVIATLILMSATVVNASNEVYYTNSHNIEMTETEYNNLLGLGFTERQIELMDESEFLANKDIPGTVLSEASKYYKRTTVMRNGIKSEYVEEITKDEALAEKQSQNLPDRGPVGIYYDGVSATSVIEIRTKIIGVSNTKMRYKVDSEWLVMPTDRYHDIIGIGIESNKVQIASVIACKIKWYTTGNVHGEDESCYPKTETTGGSAQMQLPSGSMQTIDSYVYFNVSKQANVGTITELHMCGDYAHATASVNPNTIYSHYSMHMYGIDIDYPYDLDYSQQSPACASFEGTW